MYDNLVLISPLNHRSKTGGTKLLNERLWQVYEPLIPEILFTELQTLYGS